MLTSAKTQDWFEARAQLRGDFLAARGLANAALSPIGEDSAFRRYFRLQAAGKQVVLMEAVPEGHPNATPGHSIFDFVRLSAYLRSIGLNAPEIYEADENEGYLLLEDFGDVSFKKARELNLVPQDNLYGLATDILDLIRRRTGPGDAELPRYYDSHVHKGRQRVVDWYMPAVRGLANPDDLVKSYLRVWDDIEASLPPAPTGFLHIDYHFENLMWLPDRAGLDQCGILDFQGAMEGPVPYDLANLLEDARVDVPQNLRDAMMARYCQSMTPAENDLFRAWYRILATQFHCRVIGQFLRLAIRDDKPRYLSLIPRIGGYMREGLKDPILAPLDGWFKAEGIDFSKTDGFVPAQIRPLIRPDAF